MVPTETGAAPPNGRRMSNSLPDLWDECYTGEHRKHLAPEQFKQMFCGICLNHGCQNSRGAGTLWSRRMQTQEDRLLNNPNFADASAGIRLGLPDFKDLFREALAIEISDRKGDWEPVTEAEIGQAAAELLGVIPPSGFQKPEPEPEPKPLTAKEVIVLLRGASDLETLDSLLPEGEKRRTVLNIYKVMQAKLTPPDPVPDAPPSTTLIPDTLQNAEGAPDEKEVSPPEDRTLTEREIEGQWKMRGTTPAADGKKPTYEVILYADGEWSCSCPSRENPCKHARDIAGRLAAAPEPSPMVENPTRPAQAPRPPQPLQMNTRQPVGGVMVGGGSPPVEEDPWAVPDKPKDRVIGVGGRVTFGSGKKK